MPQPMDDNEGINRSINSKDNFVGANSTAEGIIHISIDPMYTDKGNRNYALPLCKKGPRRAVGGSNCHYAGDVYSMESSDKITNYNLVNLVDGRGWWKDFNGNWCDECYAIAKEEGERIMVMMALGGDK